MLSNLHMGVDRGPLHGMTIGWNTTNKMICSMGKVTHDHLVIWFPFTHFPSEWTPHKIPFVCH